MLGPTVSKTQSYRMLLLIINNILALDMYFLHFNFLCSCYVDLIQPLAARNNKIIVVVVAAVVVVVG